MVRGHQFKLRCAAPSVKGRKAALAMDMAIAAQPHGILLKQVKDLLTFIILIDRRIVQENKFLLIPCRLQRGLQPHGFPPHDLLVMLSPGLLFVKPAPSPAQRIFLIKKAAKAP